MSFSCRIVTPSAAAFSGSVEYASIPAHDGQLGVADGRAPLLVKLGTGLLRLDTEGDAQWFAVHGGFAQVGAEGLVVLAEQCEAPSEVDLEAARAALAEANAAVQNSGSVVEAEAAQQASRTRIDLAGKN